MIIAKCPKQPPAWGIVAWGRSSCNPQGDWRYDVGVSVGIVVVDVSVVVGVRDGVGAIGVEVGAASPIGTDNT